MDSFIVLCNHIKSSQCLFMCCTFSSSSYTCIAIPKRVKTFLLHLIFMPFYSTSSGETVTLLQSLNTFQIIKASVLLLYLFTEIHCVIPKGKKLTGGLCGKVFAPSDCHIFDKDAKTRACIQVIFCWNVFLSLAKVFQEILLHALVFLIWSEYIICIWLVSKCFFAISQKKCGVMMK